MPEEEPTGMRQNQTRADVAEKFAELIESQTTAASANGASSSQFLG